MSLAKRHARSNTAGSIQVLDFKGIPDWLTRREDALDRPLAGGVAISGGALPDRRGHPQPEVEGWGATAGCCICKAELELLLALQQSG